MKVSSKLTLLLSALLLMSAFASVHMTFAEPSEASTSAGKPNAELVAEPVWSETPQGVAGSGWKPDSLVATSDDAEINPSIGSYVDPVTGDVTLYVAYVWWNPSSSWGAKWDGRVAISYNRGATWSPWWGFGWDGPISIANPSLAVNAYNNTVFVATEYYPTAGGNHSIDCWRFTSTDSKYHTVDADADDDRNPQLVSEYSYDAKQIIKI